MLIGNILVSYIQAKEAEKHDVVYIYYSIMNTPLVLCQYAISIINSGRRFCDWVTIIT